MDKIKNYKKEDKKTVESNTKIKITENKYNNNKNIGKNRFKFYELYSDKEYYDKYNNLYLEHYQ